MVPYSGDHSVKTYRALDSDNALTRSSPDVSDQLVWQFLIQFVLFNVRVECPNYNISVVLIAVPACTVHPLAILSNSKVTNLCALSVHAG